MKLPGGATIAALAAVNALGQATIGATSHFWAAPFEIGGEFGGRGYPLPLPQDAALLRHKGQAPPGAATTIAVIATDAILTKAAARRLAIVAHDGFARALWPSHTPHDGDLVFAISTARLPAPDPVVLGAAAASTMSRAIARGIYAASPAPGDLLPTWRQKFG
jgi:L-aminopeptidase/D-esterase-like protein